MIKTLQKLSWIGLSLSLLVTPSAAVESPTGVWRMSNGSVTVKIANCGPSLCGQIVGLKRPLDKAGKPKTDRKNPNPSLRSRPMIGLTVFNNMQETGTNKWKGSIYNADDGSTYRATAELAGDRFTVKACWGPICKKIRFNRIE